MGQSRVLSGGGGRFMYPGSNQKLKGTVNLILRDSSLKIMCPTHKVTLLPIFGLT